MQETSKHLVVASTPNRARAFAERQGWARGEWMSATSVFHLMGYPAGKTVHMVGVGARDLPLGVLQRFCNERGYVLVTDEP